MSAPRPPGGISDATWLFVRALLALGLLAIVGGIAFLFTPSGRELTSGIARAAGMLGRNVLIRLEAQEGPGISALSRLGCRPGLTMEARDFPAWLGDGNGASRFALPADTRVVYCGQRRTDDEIDCEVAARTYATAARRSREFWIVVGAPGWNDFCSGRFDPARSSFSAADLPTVKETP